MVVVASPKPEGNFSSPHSPSNLLPLSPLPSPDMPAVRKEEGGQLSKMLPGIFVKESFCFRQNIKSVLHK